jgi:hypothetical protein
MSAPISRIGVRNYGIDTRDVNRRRVGGKFATFMKAAGRALGTAGAMVAPFVPGGAVVKAAVMGASTFASTATADLGADQPGVGTMGAGAAGATGAGAAYGGGMSLTGGVETAMASTMPEMGMMDMLNLQLAVQREVLAYQSLSNVAKARHDAAMNSVRNIKG